MTSQSFTLDLIPHGVPPVIHASQYDRGQIWFITVLENGVPFEIPSGCAVTIQGTKPDNTGFQYACVYSGSIVSATLMQQMCAVAGNVQVEIRITANDAAQIIGSLNFILEVEEASIADDVIISETDISMIEQAIELAERVPEILQECETYDNSAEAWATGKVNGADVPSTADQYHNNAKYYAQQASTSASNAATSESNASTYASNASTSATNAHTSEQAASASANTATNAANRAEAYALNVPYIGANGNWWIWNTTTGAYVDSHVDASITVSIADVTMLSPTDTPYVTNSGTDTDPVFHLFIPEGKGIVGIAKTGTVGLVDTYTITYNDNTTSTFTVTNGKTAYQSAVEGGYDRTEQEFYEELGNFKDLADNAEAAADRAETLADGVEEIATQYGITGFQVNFETGDLMYLNNGQYIFSINTTDGELEWEVYNG